MFGLGFPELIVVFIIAFFVFGANKLPEIGNDLGKAIRGFKKAITENDDTDALPKVK
jgi:sec-independent protein translocase protein TatA